MKMLTRLLVSGLLSIFLIGCSSDDKVRVLFSGLAFHAPDGVAVIADGIADENMLILRYSDEPSQRYLAFTDMSSMDYSEEYGCSSEEFFDAVFSMEELHGSHCKPDYLSLMKKEFISGHRIKVWQRDEVRFRCTEKDNMAFCFVSSGEKFIKVDSDFLSLSQLVGL